MRSKRKSRRYQSRLTRVNDPRGSVEHPHPNSLGAADPSLLEKVKREWKGGGQVQGRNRTAG
jgi:hypothetical protein